MRAEKYPTRRHIGRSKYFVLGRKYIDITCYIDLDTDCGPHVYMLREQSGLAYQNLGLNKNHGCSEVTPIPTLYLGFRANLPWAFGLSVGSLAWRLG